MKGKMGGDHNLDFRFAKGGRVMSTDSVNECFYGNFEELKGGMLIDEELDVEHVHCNDPLGSRTTV